MPTDEGEHIKGEWVGPKTDPRGMLQVTLWVWNVACRRATNSILSVRYDVNQLRAVSVRPMVECRWCCGPQCQKQL